MLARQIAVLYLQYLGQQIDPELIKEMSARSNAVEKAYSVYRARVGGKELTENEVHDVLRTSKDSAQRRAVWEASKAVGPILDPDLKKLARLRNRAARQLGFKDFHVMQLALAEQSQEQVLRLFDELDALTRQPFHAAKAEIDAAVGPAVRRQRRRVAALALPRPVLPGVAGHLRRLRAPFTGRSTSSSSSASSTRASACRSTTCWAAATSSRSPASARTPSALTSTARATSACWPTWCRARNG